MSWFEDDDLWISLAPTLRGPAALERAEDEVDRMIELLGIAPGTRVLDLGCGPGRHAIALARRGYEVTAVDHAPSYLTHLSKAAQRHGVSVEVVRRDIRDFRRQQSFDAVICFDAFGLSDNEADDARLLANAWADLVPGGCVLVATRGKEAALHGLPERDWSWLRPGVLLLEQNSFDSSATFLERSLHLVESGRVRKFHTQERLYAGSELRRLCDAAGFSATRIMGGLDGRRMADKPQRLVALAER